MCGRYTRKAAYEALMDHYGLPVVEDEFSDIRLAPSMDCKPGSMQPVLSVNDRSERELIVMRWGFNLTIQGKNRLVFNTKSEGVLDSRMWRTRFQSKRCIVPASEFFEWPGKVKTSIRLQGREILGFAGLWGMWTNPKTNQAEPTFSIFTTEPNMAMLAIHNRQPVILDPSEYDEWLEPSERPPVHLLRVFPEELTVVTPVDSTNATPMLF